jgi:protein SDA1
MAKRVNNQLPHNLPQLQNLIKRDAESYKEEFQQQFRHFQSTLAVFELAPDQFNESLDELVMFLAQVSKCYTEDLATFPSTLVSLLEQHSTVLDPNMRLSFCRSLILLRHKGLIDPVQLHKLFFQLLRCQDKSLRSFLKDNIVNDIKNINAKGKDHKLNNELQNFMYSMLKDSATVAAKTSLDVMTALYKKNVWRDEKTVNVITTACFSKVTKILVTAVRFFLGSDEEDEEESDDDEDLPTLKEVAMQNKFNKKTRKREKYLENIKKAHKKKKKKAKGSSYNFSALHLIHDPQEFAEKLFKKLEGLTEKFEVKLMLLELVSRLIGTHQLILLNYYPYISRFLAPHQREVVRLLQFSAQAAHEMVPPDSVESVLKAIINNFVTERNSSEVMAVGLNAVRELCARCPLVMTEDLLRDLVEYKTYKDKGVMMASRSLVQLFRQINPDLLHKRDRGRPTEATLAVKAREFGELDVKEFIPGAEVIENSEEGDIENEEISDCEDSDSENKKEDTVLSQDEKVARAKEVTLGKILTDEDFRRIEAAQLKKEVVGVRKGGKGKKRTAEDADLDDAEEPDAGRKELVNLDDIEMIYKKRRHDKEARMETVKQGREGREKFGGGKKTKKDGASMTNKQKSKKKNFSMMKHKIKAKGKKSFREKQVALKKRLLKVAKHS